MEAKIESKRGPSVEGGIRVLAGTMVLIGTGLSLWVNPWFWILPAFVGVNLIQSTFTGICPAAWIFKKMGFRSCE